MDAASIGIVAMEIGGLVGGLSSGTVSDTVFGGRRAPVMVLCSAALAASLAMFWSGATVPGSAALASLLGLAPTTAAVAVWCGAVGLFSFPVHVLLGLAARELVPRGISGTAGGMVKAMGQVGSVLAGYALAKLVQGVGWMWVGTLLVACAAASAMVLVPLWHATAVVEDSATASKKQR